MGAVSFILSWWLFTNPCVLVLKPCKKMVYFHKHWPSHLVTNVEEAVKTQVNYVITILFWIPIHVFRHKVSWMLQHATKPTKCWVCLHLLAKLLLPTSPSATILMTPTWKTTQLLKLPPDQCRDGWMDNLPEHCQGYTRWDGNCLLVRVCQHCIFGYFKTFKDFSPQKPYLTLP